jgi:hypothetical protein
VRFGSNSEEVIIRIIIIIIIIYFSHNRIQLLTIYGKYKCKIIDAIQEAYRVNYRYIPVLLISSCIITGTYRYCSSHPGILFLFYRDVRTAEALLNQHTEIGDDIRAKQDEFSQLISLGEKMYKRSAA